MLYAVGEQVLLEVNFFRGQHTSWLAASQIIAGESASRRTNDVFGAPMKVLSPCTAQQTPKLSHTWSSLPVLMNINYCSWSECNVGMPCKHFQASTCLCQHGARHVPDDTNGQPAVGRASS
jgi:hypothetical protein